jgi:hypothetical protein
MAAWTQSNKQRVLAPCSSPLAMVNDLEPSLRLFQGRDQNESPQKGTTQNKPSLLSRGPWITASSTSSMFVNVCNHAVVVGAELKTVAILVVGVSIASRMLNISREASTHPRLRSCKHCVWPVDGVLTRSLSWLHCHG